MPRPFVTFIRAAPVLIVGVIIASCSDTREGPTEIEQNPASSAVQSQGTQTDDLRTLTRAVALSLQNSGLRQRVQLDMRGSPYSEQKLDFEGYLRGERGVVLLEEMTQVIGMSRTELLARLDRLPNLEFYMPVPQHRASWTGGETLFVAASLDTDDPVTIAYDLTGETVDLSSPVPPTTPTLAIVPAETRFSDPLPASLHLNGGNENGSAIGSEDTIEPCAGSVTGRIRLDCGGGGGGTTSPSTVQQRGVSVEEYITHMRALNDHAPWIEGAPEFYLLLAGAQSDGQEYEKRLNIPEGPWCGSDDPCNANWRDFGDIALIVWDSDLGTRIKVQCYEADLGTPITITVSGTTGMEGKTVGFEVEFAIEDDDDNCASNYIDIMNTNNEWYYIPDGVDNDIHYPNPPYYNGTTDLQWYGYGIQR